MNDINDEKKVKQLLNRTKLGEKRYRELHRLGYDEKDYAEILGEYVIVPRQQVRRIVQGYMWEFLYLATIGIGLAFLIFKWIN